VNNDLHTTSTGQSTHQDSVKNICPAPDFLTILPAAHSFHKKSYLRRIAFHKKILSVGHLISVSCLIYQFVGIGIDSNSNTELSQRHKL